MIKKFFVIIAVSAMFVACGNNQQAKKTDDSGECKKECTNEKTAACTAVCIGKAIDSPAEFEGKETVFNAKIAKCDESGNYYACADEDKSIELVPAENMNLADAIGKKVTLTGKLADGKIEVSKLEVAACCADKEANACTGEKKEECCSGNTDNKEAKVSGANESKQGCCGNKKAES